MLCLDFMQSHVFLLGTRIDNYTMGEALARAERLLAQGGSHYVVTPNPEILLRARRDFSFQSILNDASISLCDGTGSYLTALFIGKRLKRRITGVDFMQSLCAYAASHHKTIALIGAREGVRRTTQRLLCSSYPGLAIFETDSRSCQGITADIAFVALGSPKQEQWMAQQKDRGRFKLMVGVGGAFDMLSGELSRAPKIMRRMGCEWAWRFLQEPQRAGRIASAVIIFPLTFLRSIL